MEILSEESWHNGSNINFNSINNQKHINSSMSLFLLIFIFKIVSVNTFHLEYPIGRGGFGKVSKFKIKIFS